MPTAYEHTLVAMGMGSFNDVWLSRQGHHVTEDQEPWVNELFEWLKAVLFWLAVGRHDAALVAFVGGHRADDAMRGFATTACPLGGWRCLQCGSSEVGRTGIDRFIAARGIPDMVFTACERRVLDELVDRVFAMELSELTAWRPGLCAAVETSGIRVNEREGEMRPCPDCGSEDTAVYRWVFKSDPSRFEPAKDNLPMRSGGRRRG